MAKAKEEALIVEEITPRELEHWLELILQSKENLPIFVWGSPGIGKSAIIRQVTAKLGLSLLDVRMPQLDPTDLRGIPVPSENKAKWLPPTFLPDAKRDGERGVLFLDELNAAPPLVQASGYQLVLDRRVGEYKLPDGWSIIAAGNRAQDKAVTYAMPTPLANRFIHLDLKVHTDDWVSWAIKNQIDSKIIAFISYSPQYLNQFDPQNVNGRRSFPTPRTWEYTAKLGRIAPLETIPVKILGGVIGAAAAGQFKAYLNCYSKLPDLKAILAGQDIVPEERSVQYAVVTSLAAQATAKNISRIIDYSSLLTEELSVLIGKILLTTHRDILLSTDSSRKAWERWSKKYKEFIV